MINRKGEGKKADLWEIENRKKKKIMLPRGGGRVWGGHRGPASALFILCDRGGKGYVKGAPRCRIKKKSLLWGRGAGASWGGYLAGGPGAASLGELKKKAPGTPLRQARFEIKPMVGFRKGGAPRGQKSRPEKTPPSGKLFKNLPAGFRFFRLSSSEASGGTAGGAG